MLAEIGADFRDDPDSARSGQGGSGPTTAGGQLRDPQNTLDSAPSPLPHRHDRLSRCGQLLDAAEPSWSCASVSEARTSHSRRPMPRDTSVPAHAGTCSPSRSTEASKVPRAQVAVTVSAQLSASVTQTRRCSVRASRSPNLRGDGVQRCQQHTRRAGVDPRPTSPGGGRRRPAAGRGRRPRVQPVVTVVVAVRWWSMRGSQGSVSVDAAPRCSATLARTLATRPARVLATEVDLSPG